MSSNPILHLRKCLVRAYNDQDTHSLAKAADNPRVAQWLCNTFPQPYTIKDAENWIRIANTPSQLRHFAICEASGSVVIGGIGLEARDDIHYRTMQIGYWICEEYWHRGIGTEVVSAFSDWAFENFGHLVRLEAEVSRKRQPWLESTASAYGLWSPEWSSRIEAVVGGISKPSLGVSQDTWNRLSDSEDLIIHNGAQVNWMLPYSSLRAVNVLSTLECIRLCTEGKPKSLTFVSSTSTLDTQYYVQLSRDVETNVLETDDLQGSRKGLETGYGQTKWASEYIIRNAGVRGLTGAIVRPGYITGDPMSGISVTDDFLVRLWKGCLQIGARPDITNTVNAVPVSQVSRIVVAAGLLLPTVTGQPLSVAQVPSHPRLTLNEWIGALEHYGYHTPLVSYRDWRAKVVRYAEDEGNEEHALLPLFHFVTGTCLPIPSPRRWTIHKL
ncbi:hypothetical protein FGADI_9342 [Fusarium gaditjirri]|uniref:N-acetyltransferase domain-containing protein n=1 Tax=Fusarium gaditjirri TaxID=282569 RepID=A0A8H4T0C6_9HYPO|nr:hypothetical protein FGADI_9342 [Fusarium gaditjirri]